MKSCKRDGCQNKIPATIKVDGKSRNLKNRIYCFECSPFDEHNTKQLNQKERPERKCICSLCNRSFTYKRNTGATTVACPSCLVTRSRQKRKRMAVEYKGGSCIVCGYNKCMRALEFHHLDPSKKDFGLSESGTQRSWDIQKIELDKCVLLCCRCHAEVHSNLLDIGGLM
jgi:uncharacterized CHY-type Zn-finger protein